MTNNEATVTADQSLLGPAHIRCRESFSKQEVASTAYSIFGRVRCDRSIALIVAHGGPDRWQTDEYPVEVLRSATGRLCRSGIRQSAGLMIGGAMVGAMSVCACYRERRRNIDSLPEKRMSCWIAARLLMFAGVMLSVDGVTDHPLTLSGRVTKSDGSPAGDATVFVSANWPNQPTDPVVTARCDADGRFEDLTSPFGYSTLIYVVSEDQQWQSERYVPDFMARAVAAEPLLLTLQPAKEIRVTVVAKEQPVADCEVMLNRRPGSRQQTDANGQVTFRIPADTLSKGMTAFHPKRGIGGWQRDRQTEQLPEEISISLEKPAPHTIRVVDQRGQAVSDFSMLPAVYLPNDAWAIPAGIAGGHATTGPDGSVVVPWIPGQRQNIDPIEVSRHWQMDDFQHGQHSSNARVRRKQALLGRVRFPDGQPREGVLIVAKSSGPGPTGDHSQARTDANGTFRLYLAPDHAYALGVRDLEWTSEIQADVYLRTKDDEVTFKRRGTFLDAQPAVPVTAQVVDSDGAPIGPVWVNFASVHTIDWIDLQGKERHSTQNIHHWVRTDRTGQAMFGTVPGKMRIEASRLGWRDKQRLVVEPGQPATVTFREGEQSTTTPRQE